MNAPSPYLKSIPSNPDLIADQFAFQVTFGHGAHTTPCIPPKEIQERRRSLVSEEFNEEFLVAWEHCYNIQAIIEQNKRAGYDIRPFDSEAESALAEMGDVIADSIYVLIGTAFEYGLPIAEIWRAVQTANMAKLWTWEQIVGDIHFGLKYKDRIPHTTTQTFPGTEGWNFQCVLRHPFPGCRYVVRDAIGKVKKPPTWTAPDIKAIVRKALTSSTD